MGLAIVVGWFLLPASLESLSVALGGLAAELKVLPLPSGDVLKLVGGVALLVAMWRWTTPRSARGRSEPPEEVSRSRRRGEGRGPPRAS